MKILFNYLISLFTSKSDNYIKYLVKNSYKSLRVVGRGTVRIDPKEVINTEEFIKAKQKITKNINID